MAREFIFTLPVNEIALEVVELLLPHIKGLKSPPSPSEDRSELLTRKEAALNLRISLPTLDKWTRVGKLTGYRIGRQVRYKQSELISSIARMQI